MSRSALPDATTDPADWQPSYPWRQELHFRLAGLAGYAVIRGVCLTMRIRMVNWEILEQVEKQHGAGILAFWHGRQFMLVHLFRNRGVHVLVSRSPDGEYIHRVLARSGNNTVRGSTSRGGSEAYRGLRSKLEQGYWIAFTPDGPRGPAGTLGPGVIAIASRSGRPIVPMATSARPCWRLRSWDRFLVPRPFSRGALVLGDPILVPPDLPPEEFESWRVRVARALDEAANQADRLVGSPPEFSR